MLSLKAARRRVNWLSCEARDRADDNCGRRLLFQGASRGAAEKFPTARRALMRVAKQLVGFISIREPDTVNYFHYPVPFIIQRRTIQRREAARANVFGG